MNVQLAATPPDWALGTVAKLPKRFPPFNTPTYYVFSIIWLAALVLAVLGPVMGLYDRYTSPADNSQLFMGSRAGFAVAPGDATSIRFTIGNEAREAGIRPGDKIIAIYGLPMPSVMPVTEQALAEHGQDPAYVAMDNLLFGTDKLPFPLTVRSADGKVHDVTVTTDERHIRTAASSVGVPPILLSFVDVIHVIFYPFLLWAAWILHRRNARDVVSSVLSLAILLMIGSELPSSAYLGAIGVPRAVNVALYDLSNILLLAGILLFPHGELSWQKIGLLLALPVLMLLHGSLYQTYLAAFMIVAALTLLRHLRRAENGETLQQIRWALLGFSGYAVLRAVSILADYFKWSTGSFGQQLALEILAGLTLALGVLVLQFGLLIALVRYRLYDAEFVISKSANFALITLVVAAIFAGVADALKQIIYNYYGNTNSEGPVIMAAALSTVLVNPIQERIQSWSEKRFQKNLVLLRDDLPDCVRDMRETASLTEMVASDICEPKDKVFPIRVPLVPSSDDEAPIGFLLVGPRPDGSIPSRDEQKALAGVSEDVARAIRTVIRREAREADVAKLIADNERRIAALEAMLGKTGAGARKPPAQA
jgi:hypothetical protein